MIDLGDLAVLDAVGGLRAAGSGAMDHADADIILAGDIDHADLLIADLGVGRFGDGGLDFVVSDVGGRAAWHVLLREEVAAQREGEQGRQST